MVLGLAVWAASGMGGDGELGAALAVSLGLVLMTGFLGATPGKAIMRLQVEGPRGGAPGVPRAFVRWAVTVGPTVGSGCSLVGVRR